MQTNNAHEYTDEQIQVAIDASKSATAKLCEARANEELASIRIAGARAFLAALPKPPAQAQQAEAQLTGTQPVNLDEAWLQARPWTPAVGDTVRLKSGGPVMTVYDIAKDKSFICCVHNTKGLCDYTTLPAACLTPAKEGQP